MISKHRALNRINALLLEQLLVPTLDPTHEARSLAQGLPASPGAASGSIVFDADTAEQRGRVGESVILVREETKPEDIHGFFAAQGAMSRPLKHLSFDNGTFEGVDCLRMAYWFVNAQR